MTFIYELIKKIWEPYSKKYQKLYQKYSKLDEQALKDKVLDYVRKDQKGPPNESQYVITGLKTCGCPHWNKDGVLAGCSFCDFFSGNFEGFVLLSTLKKKNEKLYGSVIRECLVNDRGNSTKASLAEHITGFDSLNEMEIGKDIVTELFHEDKELFANGIIYLICETRITSISTESIRNWKKNVRKKLLVESGIEVGNDWIRNHWLNKNVTDKEIYAAFEILGQEKCAVSSDILLGIPGLTDYQSIELFIQSFLFCMKAGSDYVIVSPLLCKGNDLQSIIVRELGEDRTLSEKGIVQGKHVGIHILSVFTALYSLLQREPAYAKKILFASGHLNAYCSFVNLDSGEDEKKTVLKITEALLCFNETKDPVKFSGVYSEVAETEYYKCFVRNLKQQDGIDQIKQTMLTVAKQLSEVYWKEEWKNEINRFEQELMLFDVNELIREKDYRLFL